MKTRWSQAARADVRGLKRYIARDAPFYALQFCERLIASVDKLAEHPRAGREVPEAADTPHEVRELIFRDYRITVLYRNQHRADPRRHRSQLIRTL